MRSVRHDRAASTAPVRAVLAAMYLAPLRARLERARGAVKDGDGSAKAWEELADVYDDLALGTGAGLCRNAAREIRTAEKRFKLTYPDNLEHIVEA